MAGKGKGKGGNRKKQVDKSTKKKNNVLVVDSKAKPKKRGKKGKK